MRNLRPLPAWTSRRALAVAGIAAAFPFLVQCDRDADPVAPIKTEAPVHEPAAVTPAPVAAASRADMIAAAARAASAYASGEAPSGSDPLVGRSFAIRTAFGCGVLPEGPAPSAPTDGLVRAAWGPERKTIQITLTPGDWTGSALMAAPNAEADWEAVEGFWLARPWLAAEGCPSVVSDPLQSGNAAPAVQTVGVAAVFEEGASRVGRRNGRAYGFTVRPDNAETPLSPPQDGYRLLMEGRVTGFPNGRAFRCRASGPDQRPVCVAAIQLDRVAFTRADGAVMSEWRTS